MADCLETLKQKYRINHQAYRGVDGIFKVETCGIAETFIAQFRLDPEDECVDRLSCGLETLCLMHSYRHHKDYDRVWLIEDEWIETLCWYLFKKPRTFAKTWQFWISGCFDALDRDNDGYINEDEFNFFYESTNRKGDKQFAKRAFAVFDTKKTGGKVSRKEVWTMADCLETLKQKYRMNIHAYLGVDGIFKSDSCGISEAYIAQFRLDPEDECIDRLCCGLETLCLMNSYRHHKDYDRVWLIADEWIETLSWYLFKKPRTFAKTWHFWISGCFDALDQDNDGYINEDEFNFFYECTNRKGDKEFAKRAFALFDTRKTGGKVSRKEFVKAYVKYFTDPDVTYDDLPLY